MPFSWKNKSRPNRFSKLVADHLHSPNRGGSLVVETGFPTSIIDLYVRNRGRFRKSSAKKPNRSPLCLSSPSSDLVVDDLRNYSSGDSDFRAIDDEIIEEDVVVVDDEIKIENYNKTEAKLNGVMVVMLKVLFMVVLVIGSKRFNIAITVSAFLLLFLESVGKQLKSSNLDSKPLFECRLQGTNNIRSSKQAATVVVCSEVLEIEEQVESKQEELDEVRSEVLIEISHKSSRKGVLKSRIKKLVPKKLRRSSMDSKHEICYEFEEETVKSAETVKPLICLNECLDLKGETFCILKQDHDKIEESRTDLQQKFGCLILFLIVLVGLIGGRFLALVIVLSWSLILNLQSRNVKFFISRC